MSEINSVNNTSLPFKDVAKIKIKDSVQIETPIKPTNSAEDTPKAPIKASYSAEDTPKIPIKPTSSAENRPKIPFNIADKDPIEIKIEPKPRFGLNPTAGTMSEAATLTLNVKTIGELMREEKDLRNLYVKNMYNELLNNRFISRTFLKNDLSKQLSRKILGDGYIIRTMAETRSLNLSEYKRENIIEVKLEERLEVNNYLHDSTRKYDQDFRNPINVKFLEQTRDNYKNNIEKINEKLIKEYGLEIVSKNIITNYTGNERDTKQSFDNNYSNYRKSNNTPASKSPSPIIDQNNFLSTKSISNESIERQNLEKNAPILQIIPNIANEQAISIATPYFVSFVFNNQSNFGTSITVNTSI
jgi:hypothetical protein